MNWAFLKEPAWWFSMFIVGLVGIFIWAFALMYQDYPIIWMTALITYAGIGSIIVLVYHEHTSETGLGHD